MTTATTSQHCPAWCIKHDEGATDLCIGPRLEMNFGPGEPGNSQFVHHAAVLAYSEPDGRVTLSLILNNGTDSGDMTVKQARQIGAALIQAANNATGEPPAGSCLTLVPGGAR